MHGCHYCLVFICVFTCLEWPQTDFLSVPPWLLAGCFLFKLLQVQYDTGGKTPVEMCMNITWGWFIDRGGGVVGVLSLCLVVQRTNLKSIQTVIYGLCSSGRRSCEQFVRILGLVSSILRDRYQKPHFHTRTDGVPSFFVFFFLPHPRFSLIVLLSNVNPSASSFPAVWP